LKKQIKETSIKQLTTENNSIQLTFFTFNSCNGGGVCGLLWNIWDKFGGDLVGVEVEAKDSLGSGS
jgi:hypothetical protein